MDRLRDKTCLVTAAGQGIGRSTAIAMHREGGHVVATDINAEALAELGGQGLETAVLDVLDADAIEALRDRVGAVDVLFNCAGFVDHGTILDCDEEKWDFSFDLNVRSMYRMIRAFLPGMIEKGAGTIVNVASTTSTITAVPNRFIYGTTKAAVIGLTKSVAADFVTRGIRANAICPGVVETPSLEERLRARGGDYEKVRAAFTAAYPMGRVGRPEEVAALAVHLASDESAFTTGVAYVIDGGFSTL
jgi:2-keto-3-deoxy-L-fuconate dehydrogenase